MGSVINAQAADRRTYQRRPSWFGILPIVPTLLFLGVIFLYPVLQLLWLSIVDKQGNFTAHNYAALVSEPVYINVLIGTAKISLWTTLISVMGAYPIAYMLSTTSVRYRNVLILWVLMPFWTSFLVRTFSWIILLGHKGAINQFLLSIGLIDAPLELLYNFTAVIIGMVHVKMPLAVISMLAVMQNIPPNLVKAASTLGARGGQAFWRVYFPLSLPGVVAGGLLVFISSMGFFIIPALMGGPREIMIAQIIIFEVEELLNWGFAGAVSVLLMVAVLLTVYVYDRLVGMSASTIGNRASSAPEGLIARLGGWLGTRIIALLGAVCGSLGALWDRIFKARPDRPRRSWSRPLLWVVGSALIFYLAVPTFFVIPASFTQGSFLEWPPEWFSLRWYQEYFNSPVWQAATLRSFVIAIFTAILSMLIGVPAAFVMVRRALPARALVTAFFLSPLILPNIIVAVALFYFYARIGLVGTSLGLVLGHTVFAVPFVIVTVMAVLKNYDERLDQAAWSLGANKLTTLWRITFPLIRSGMIAAYLFAFIKSFDELTVAIFVTGGLVTTLPKQMWSDAVMQVRPTLAAVSTCILLFVTVVILVAEHYSRRSKRSREG